MEITFISAFFVGLFSTLHCVGMCGGIIGALTFSLPEKIRNNRWRLIPYVSAYNFGRITSYCLAGALAGGLGDQITGLVCIWQAGFLPLPKLSSLVSLFGKNSSPLAKSLFPLKTQAMPIYLDSFGAGFLAAWFIPHSYGQVLPEMQQMGHC